ncbi:MAG: sulfite exporter TauE/SafE family protein [Rhizobiaceae bacterium]|nr:sulfite exporter TauE/SafE family protein [Rhizobiaceae bacterium]
MSPFELSEIQYLYIGLAALLVGFTKTSVGGVGILAVLLMALAIPGKGSPGVLLPMLVVADIFAVVFYRRECQWGVLVKLVPLTLVGIIIGYFLLDIIPAQVFERIIGVIILIMLVLEFIVSKTGKKKFDGWPITVLVGIFAGIATMIANAAGPIFGIYLLQMGLAKKEFVGTRSWFFLLLNVFKLPFSANLGLITVETLKLDLMFLPAIVIGAIIGYWVLGLINVSMFKWLIRAASLVACIRLILF